MQYDDYTCTGLKYQQLNVYLCLAVTVSDRIITHGPFGECDERLVGLLMVQQRQRLSPSSFVPVCASIAHNCLLSDTEQAHRLNLKSQTVARPVACGFSLLLRCSECFVGH